MRLQSPPAKSKFLAVKRDEINEITVPLEVGKRFYRFALEDE